MNAMLYQQVVQSRNRLFYAAGEVPLDQPVTMFFRKLEAAQETQVGATDLATA
jgi:hypothetical protein